ATVVAAALPRADGGHGKTANSADDGGVAAGAGVNANENANANAGATDNTNANGGVGHTPITICHWVPAHGGSFITITIDDDGLHGHGRQHENDIIPAPASGCPGAQVAGTATVGVGATETASPDATST